MTNKTDQATEKQKESNDDKGKQDTYKDSTPEKKPNAEPEKPLDEQK